MRRFLMLVLTAACCQGGAAVCAGDGKLAEVRDNGIIEVRTPHYALSFFPGCVFPFRFSVGGRAFPEPVWLDRLTDAEKRQYNLRLERFAEREILCDSREMFAVRMTGSYCLSDDAGAPGKPYAAYVWRCSPEFVEVEVTVYNPERRQWREVHVLSPGWKTSLAASACVVDGEAAGPNSAGFFGGSASAGILFPCGEWRMSGKAIRGYDNQDRRFFGYLSGVRQRDWDGSELKIPAIRMTFFRVQQ